MGLFKKKDDGGKHLTEVEKERKFYKKLAASLSTTTKQLIWLYAVAGVIWITCSYVLAFMGKEQIAESLSSTVCDIIVGTVVGYLVTSTVSNIFKYSGMPWEPKNQLNRIHTNYNVKSASDAEEIDPATIGPEDESGEPN